MLLKVNSIHLAYILEQSSIMTFCISRYEVLSFRVTFGMTQPVIHCTLTSANDHKYPSPIIATRHDMSIYIVPDRTQTLWNQLLIRRASLLHITYCSRKN